MADEHPRAQVQDADGDARADVMAAWSALPYSLRQPVIDYLTEAGWNADAPGAEAASAFTVAARALQAIAAAAVANDTMNLNQVTLPASDVRRSIGFYRGMGFELIVESEHYARFLCPSGDATFSVHAAPGGFSTAGVVIYFESAALDRLVEMLKGRGYAFVKDPADEPWLWREARLLDPDGNEICLFHAGENRVNPPWRVSRFR